MKNLQTQNTEQSTEQNTARGTSKDGVCQNPLRADQFHNEFHRPCIRVGSASFLAALVLSYIPAIMLWVLFGIAPRFSEILSVATVIISVSIVWWIVQPISYFPVLGTAGSYMAFLVGGLNVRVPCALAAQTAVNAEPGSQRGELMASMGIAGSVVTTLLAVTLGVVGGLPLLSNLPEAAKNTFRYVPVSIYATLLANLVTKRPDLAVFGVMSSIVLLNAGILIIPYFLLLLLNVILCAAMGVLLHRRIKK